MITAEDIVGKVAGSREVEKLLVEDGCSHYDVAVEIKSMYVVVCARCKTYQHERDIDTDGICDKCRCLGVGKSG